MPDRVGSPSMGIVNQSAYARRHGVTSTSVRYWIRTAKITAPAVMPDGRINREAADAQLAALSPEQRDRPRQTRAPRPEAPAADPALVKTFAREILPAAASLMRSNEQRELLQAIWRRYLTPCR